MREKMPFIALSALFCVITLLTQWQGRALRAFAEIPFLARLQVVPIAYVVYLRKMFWPSDLVPFYPYPADGLPLWKVAAAALLLIGNTVVAWRQRKRRPYLIVGWLWYVLSLVPVIGLVQVGEQPYADRYTYLPLIGIFIMMAWGIPDLFGELIAGWTKPKPIFMTVAISTVVACSVMTRSQIGYWKDDFRLWGHTLEVSPQNDVAHNNIANALIASQKLDEAVKHYAAAVGLNPKNYIAQANLAKGLHLQGKVAQAVERLRTALQVNPENDLALVELGRICSTEGRVHEAVDHFRESLRIRPDNLEVYVLLGEALMAEGKLEEAVQSLTEETLLRPEFPGGHHELGLALGQLQRWPEAAARLERALDLLPKDASFRCDLARMLLEIGETVKAAEQYRKASEIQPGWMSQFNVIASNLLNLKGVNLGQGQRALKIASELCQATGYKDPQFLDTLAAAYAATENMDRARATAKKAADLAANGGEKALAERIRERAKSYGPEDCREKQ